MGAEGACKLFAPRRRGACTSDSFVGVRGGRWVREKKKKERKEGGFVPPTTIGVYRQFVSSCSTERHHFHFSRPLRRTNLIGCPRALISTFMPIRFVEINWNDAARH